jgi:hypothetical protein
MSCVNRVEISENETPGNLSPVSECTEIVCSRYSGIDDLIICKFSSF